MKAKELREPDGRCSYCQTKTSHPVKFTGVHRKDVLVAAIGLLIAGISVWFLKSDPDVVIKGSGMAVLAVMGLLFGGSFGVGLSLVAMYRWLSRNLIGQTYFHFTDEDGTEHIHKDNPTLATSPWYAWWKEHGDTIPVFQLRYGGWFRKSKIIGGPAGKWWTIERSWDGFVNALFVGAFGHGVFVGDGTKDIVESLMQKWPNLAAVVSYAEKFEQAEQQLEEMKLKLDQEGMQGLRLRLQKNHLGTIIMRVMLKIEQMRETMGRSQHAREIRKFLEAELEKIVQQDKSFKNVIREWRDKAKELEEGVGTAALAQNKAAR